jgi:hypothetical protein
LAVFQRTTGLKPPDLLALPTAPTSAGTLFPPAVVAAASAVSPTAAVAAVAVIAVVVAVVAAVTTVAMVAAVAAVAAADDFLTATAAAICFELRLPLLVLLQLPLQLLLDFSTVEGALKELVYFPLSFRSHLTRVW